MKKYPKKLEDKDYKNMTLLEYYAGQALIGFLSSRSVDEKSIDEESIEYVNYAEKAIEIAKLMIYELEKLYED